jgi:hypothetical protein
VANDVQYFFCLKVSSIFLEEFSCRDFLILSHRREKLNAINFSRKIKQLFRICKGFGELIFELLSLNHHLQAKDLESQPLSIIGISIYFADNKMNIGEIAIGRVRNIMESLHHIIGKDDAKFIQCFFY